VNDILIDANVIFGLYKEEMLEIPIKDINLTESPKVLFKKIDQQKDIIFLDDFDEQRGQIINEWKRPFQRDGKEWFAAWYEKFFQLNRIKQVTVDVSCSHHLTQKLFDNGFPQAGGDKWYVRTAKCIVLNKNGLPDAFLVTIISEDIDFFEPSQKNVATGADRIRILQAANGVIPSMFAAAKIRITCISNY